jgi:hypothetical protein
VTIERERTDGDEEREQHNHNEQRSRYAERASRMSEELLAAPSRRSFQPRADQDAVLATRSAATNRA